MSLAARGQEIGFTQFFVNPALLNPSFVGAEGRPALYLGYRKQWMGVDGSPTIMNFSFQSALPNRVNVGINVNNTTQGLVTNTGALFTGGYTLPLATNQFLRFGMSVGATFTKVDISALNFGSSVLNNPTDPILTNLAGNTIQLAGNLGISYHSKGFHVGVSVPSLFQPAYLTSSSFNADFKAFDNIIVHASNRFMLQKGKNAFEPYVIYRLSKGLPGQLEAAALFHYQQVGWIGASYKQDFGISGLVGFKANKILAIGYSYSLPTSGDGAIAKASHEIQLVYLLNKPKKEVEQTYSFVNTEIILKKKKEPQLVVKKTEPKPVPPKPQPKPEEVKPVEAEHVDIAPAEHVDEQEKMSRLEEHADNPMETHDETNHPHAERHEFVKRGGHQSEMDLGNYVIVGVFGVEANAKKYSEGLQKLGFKDVDYGYLSENRMWYVHIEGSDDINESRTARDSFRKLRIFRDAWLLTVHQ